MSTSAPDAGDEKRRPKQGRSPAYPSISLGEALSKAQSLYEKEGKYPVPMPSAFAAWGYGAKSSSGREVRAALKYYGLITIEGGKDTGKVKLTDKALRVLLDEREDQTEKQALIRDLALTPPIHKRLYDQFPDGIKSVASAEHFLIFDQSYNKAAAAEVIKCFLSTTSYAKLFEPAANSDAKGVRPTGGYRANGQVEVGDLVNVEVNGALVFEKPTRVRAVHDGIVLVEGSNSGARIEQVHLIEKSGATPLVSGEQASEEAHRLPLASAPEMFSAPDWREERLLDDAGEEILIRYKGNPSRSRYEFIRDYLDFKLRRIKDQAA